MSTIVRNTNDVVAAPTAERPEIVSGVRRWTSRCAW